MDGNRICEQLNTQNDRGASLEQLLHAAVDYIHHSDSRFHWTGIYELFPDDVLRLGPFIGAPTDHVFIGVGEGVCGSAVAEKRTKNIPDVTKEPNYLACSASTRSELVVLVRSGDTIFSQIDIDSHECNAFDKDTVREIETIASWLAQAYLEHRHLLSYEEEEVQA